MQPDPGPASGYARENISFMKRTLLSLIIILILVAAASCHKKPAARVKPKPGAHRSMPDPLPPAPGAGPEKAVLKPVEDVDNSDKKMIEKYYPEVQGLGNAEVEAKINASIRQAADMNDQVRMLMEDVEYNPSFVSEGKATFNRDGLLSVSVFQTFMARGLPHESYVQTSRTFRLADGAELKLADLFKPGSDWAERVNGAVRKHVAGSGISLLRGYEGVDAPDDRAGFYLTDEGIVVYYQIYDYTSYMDGVLEVTVPWGAVLDILAVAVAQPA